MFGEKKVKFMGKWAPMRSILNQRLSQFSYWKIIHEAAWLSAGVSFKMVVNVGTLYYLTQDLGVDRVGRLFAVFSLFACVVPIVQLGTYDLTVRQIARGEQPQLVAGRAMRISTMGFVSLLPLMLLLKPLLADQVSWLAFLLTAISELFVMRVLTNVLAVATGLRLHYVAAGADTMIALSRFLAAYMSAQLNAGLNEVVIAQALTSYPAALVAFAWLLHRTGRPVTGSEPLFADVSDHITMVFAWSAEMFARDGDKLVLTKFSDAAQTGIYGTAVRLFGVTLVPVDILSQVFRPRLSQAITEGKREGASLWTTMAALLGGFGILTGIGLFCFAYFLPQLFPSLIKSEFAEVRSALMYLSFVPCLYGIQRATVIDAIAHGAVRAYAVATTAGMVCGISVVAILAPSLGWRAACFASGLYFMVSGLATWVLTRKFPAVFPPSDRYSQNITRAPVSDEQLETTRP